MTQYETIVVTCQPPRVKEPLVGREGIVFGQSDPYPDGHRDYGIHFNHLGEVRTVPEGCLRPAGRKAKGEEIVTRSRVHPSGRLHGPIRTGK